MLSDNQIFTIDASVPHDKIQEISLEITKNLDKIKTIEIKQEEGLTSSSLLSLLLSIKHTKPEISIPLIDEKNSSLNGLGKFSIVN